MNLYEAIGVRRSVRKYSNKEVTEKMREQILAFARTASPLNDRIQVDFEIVDNRDKDAWIKGVWKAEAPWYLVLYSEPEEGYGRNGGYLMEQIVLYMTVKGLGTCYLGGSFIKKKRSDGKRQVMIVAFGYPEGKLFRESSLAKRLPLNELWQPGWLLPLSIPSPGVLLSMQIVFMYLPEKIQDFCRAFADWLLLLV